MSIVRTLRNCLSFMLAGLALLAGGINARAAINGKPSSSSADSSRHAAPDTTSDGGLGFGESRWGA